MFLGTSVCNSESHLFYSRLHPNCNDAMLTGEKCIMYLIEDDVLHLKSIAYKYEKARRKFYYSASSDINTPLVWDGASNISTLLTWAASSQSQMRGSQIHRNHIHPPFSLIEALGIGSLTHNVAMKRMETKVLEYWSILRHTEVKLWLGNFFILSPLMKSKMKSIFSKMKLLTTDEMRFVIAHLDLFLLARRHF